MKKIKIKIKIVIVFALLSVMITASHAVSNSRFALVIGNSNYEYASKLKNPGNDSADIAAVLKNLKFETQLIQNATKQEIKNAVSIFLFNLKNEGGVGLFYYAGHGVQLEGNNYLIPVETKTGTQMEIKSQSFNISTLLNDMGKIESATNIIILDACRDNPFTNIHAPGYRSTNNRSLARVNVPKLDSGLSKLSAPANTFIAFATAPGEVAVDGDGRNSPYTAKLIEAIQRPGLTIGDVFREVRSSVVKQSRGRQIPWETSSLIDDFYFKYRTLIPMGF